MRFGPNFEPPPRSVIVAINARAPGFWQRFASSLDSLEDLDVTAVNWFRSAEHNQAVGGAVGSQHRWGAAVDLVVAAAQKAEATRRLKRAGWLVIDEGDHLHVQAFPSSSLLRSAGIAPG